MGMIFTRQSAFTLLTIFRLRALSVFRVFRIFRVRRAGLFCFRRTALASEGPRFDRDDVNRPVTGIGARLALLRGRFSGFRRLILRHSPIAKGEQKRADQRGAQHIS